MNKRLAIIPARGGSRGIPRKNLIDFLGAPLINWTIWAALDSQCFERVLVSTEDEEIAAVSVGAGAEVPFLRPAGLAADDSSSVDVCLDVLSRLQTQDAYRPTEFVLLQATSPLRGAADIQGLVEFATEKRLESVVSVTQPFFHPLLSCTLDNEARLHPLFPDRSGQQRQQLGPCRALNGAIYFTTTERFESQKNFFGADTHGYDLPRNRSFDIDEAEDLEIARYMGRLLNLKPR